MACLYPRTVGFLADGKTISYSLKKINSEFAVFQLPCGKCTECRLDYAKEWALRSIKEAMMYEKNSFVTLTYNDENLGENKLQYSDFQDFVQKLRDKILETNIKGWTSKNGKEKHQYREEFKEELEKLRISIFSTGEYGTKSKRKHFHALIFNYYPGDAIYYKSNDIGDKIYTSDTLNALWGRGFVTVGAISLESAGYCARYAAKSLEHGHDGEHQYTAISKKSNKNAIGKKWIEKYWKNVFELGYVDHEGKKMPIPRYFKKWLQKNQPEQWELYITGLNSKRQLLGIEKTNKERLMQMLINEKRPVHKGAGVSQLEHKRKIAKQKFNNLNKETKL